MPSLLSLGFEYKGYHHSFLARIKENGNKTEYHVTIINEEMQNRLFGTQIITSVNGQIIMDMPAIPDEQQVLKHHIAKALTKYLQERSLSSY